MGKLANTAQTKGSRISQPRKKLSLEGISLDAKPMMSIDEQTEGEFTLKDFAEKQAEFIISKVSEGLSPRTLSDYNKHFQYLNNWLESTSAVKGNRCAESGVFIGYLGYLISQFKPATVNIRLRTLKCYLRWLYSEKYIKEDFTSKLKLIKVPKDTIKPLSPAEVKKILKGLDLSDYPEYRDFCIMIVMLETGVRINEACNILLDDIDRKLKVLTVRSETSKTREERHLPVCAKTFKYLSKLIDIAEANYEPYLFNSSHGGQLNPTSISHRFEVYGKREGIPKRTTPHVFRHTFAVQAVKAGIDIFTLQKIMGHSEISTTRQYIQLNTDDLINSHHQLNVLSRFI